MSEPLDRVDSFQYPSGHLGHLSQPQKDALEDFKQLCEENGYYKPGTGSELASHSDETMLRYLRARKFNANDAWTQFKDTEDMRKENDLPNYYDNIDVNDYEATRRLYPQWTGRRDRRGIPVYVFRVADLDSKAVSAYEQSIPKGSGPPDPKKVPIKLLRLSALYENLTNFVMPLCTSVPDRPHIETPITQSNNIVDISRVGLRQFWNLKGHMQDASQLATAHYPETLDRIFIIGAPTFFPTVWGWIKRWFDPITVSKIFILGASDMKSTLETYIDPANIPKQYGGELDFEWGMMPVLEPTIVDAIEWHSPSLQNGGHTIPTGPIRWREDPDGKLTAYAIGTENGVRRETRLGTLKSRPKPLQIVPEVVTADQGGDIPETTAGTATHPKQEGDLFFGTHPGDATPPVDMRSPGLSKLGSIASPVEGTSQKEATALKEIRSGTSESRFADQDRTLAAGQLEEGTPDNAVNEHGYGDKSITMEPRTVGQAPKEIDIPRGTEEPKDTSYIGQAKALAGQAYEAGTTTVTNAMSTIGLSEKAEVVKQDEVAEVKVTDERVEKLENSNVEDFLRSKHTSSNGNTVAPGSG